MHPEPGTLEKELDIYRLLHVKSLISFFIYEFLIPYRERVSLRESEPYGTKVMLKTSE